MRRPDSTEEGLRIDYVWARACIRAGKCLGCGALIEERLGLQRARAYSLIAGWSRAENRFA